MQHIGRMDVLETPQDLVEEVANVVIAQMLCFQQLVQVSLHQRLHYIAVYIVKDCKQELAISVHHFMCR